MWLIHRVQTSGDTILLRRAKRLRRLTGNEELKSQAEIDQHKLTAKEVAKMTLVRPIMLGLREPIVLSINLYVGFAYSLLYWCGSSTKPRELFD